MSMTLGNSDTLYIRIDKKKIIFARYDRVKDSTLNYSVFHANANISLNANMHEAIVKVPLAKGDFNMVNISVTGEVTLVPLNEFDEDDIEDLYFFNIPVDKKRRHVYFDTLPRLNSVMLFSIEKDLAHTIMEEYPNASFHSTQMPLVLHYVSCCQTVNTPGKLFVYVEDDTLILAAFRNGKICLLNSYMMSCLEDALFYLLSVARQWNIQAETDEVYFSGERKICEEILTKTRTYLPNAFLLKPEEEFNRHVLVLTKDLPYDMIALLFRAY